MVAALGFQNGGLKPDKNSSNSSKYSVGRAFACSPEGGACLPKAEAGDGLRDKIMSEESA